MTLERPVVSIKQGKLRGVVETNVCNNKQFFAFRGIPYAKPPIGALRFKDPLPAKEWSHIKDASEFGEVCAHQDLVTKRIIGGDDCLYLNVYTPGIEATVKRPVMVWIHGGGFHFGSGNDNLYGPDYLIMKDVVLVTFNYRFGVLGFLNLENEVAPGNQGLKDQVMALHWIRDNIEKFSGDPNNVTIFGESAGAASVDYLTMSPMGEGLFHKAISQSGVSLNPWAFLLKDPSRYGYQLAANLGFKSRDPQAVVDFLRTIEPHKLVQFQLRLKTPEEEITTISLFRPGIDYKSSNPFLTQPPKVAMQLGIKVPYLLGYNECEGSILCCNINPNMPNTERCKRLGTNFQSVLPDSILEELEERDMSTNELKHLYFNDTPNGQERIDDAVQLFGDIFFVHGIYETARVLSEKNECPTYLYKFCYDNPEVFFKNFWNITTPGATHSQELFYLFYARILQQMQVGAHQPGTVDHKVMDYLTTMWTNFARTGNPTPVTTDLVPILWEPLERNGDKYNILIIEEELRMESPKKGELRCEWPKSRKNKL